ncbi:hypothetical protein BC830DRAFT_885109 [Chytriomyces sp. MP71]|nr:hypothetical protein BC830DRAFT_885109 [Chytriomyces sp. MP71]
MEAHFNATQAISIAKRSNTTQTDGSMIAAAAEPLIPRSPYQNLTTAELIEAIIAKNRETDFQVQQVHLPLIVESVGDVESIKLLSRVNDEQDVTVSAAELYPVHNAKNELEHEGEALSRNEEKNLTYSDDKGELLLDLQSTMKAKAELQRELAIRNKEMEKLKHQHGEKMSKLERELEASTRELNKAKTDLDESASQKERLKEEHDKRVKHLESQIIKAKTKIKEQERVIKEKEMSDRRASDMQQEVEKLQVALNNAKKKAKEASLKRAESKMPLH